MTDDGKGGAVLLVATAAGLATMALHPTPHDLFGAEGPLHAARVGVFVHGLAIASAPLSFLGGLSLFRRTAAADRLSLAALVCYGFALMAVVIAAAVSGFVVTSLALIDHGAAAAAPHEAVPRAVYQLAGLLNQAFARIYVVASSAALLLWSLTILRGRTLPRGIAVYGLVISPVLLALVVTGSLRLDVHGFGLVVLLQSIWFTIAGICLLRASSAERRSNEKLAPDPA
jgi:hypothetical protein